MYTKEQLKSLISNGAHIVFTKADGTERKMHCTLDMNQIPVDHHPTGSGKTQSESVLAVYDLEKNAWRSFRIDSVKSAEAA